MNFSRMRVKGFAGEGERGFAERLVLGGVCVNQLSDVLGVRLPVDDQ